MGTTTMQGGTKHVHNTKRIVAFIVLALVAVLVVATSAVLVSRGGSNDVTPPTNEQPYGRTQDPALRLLRVNESAPWPSAVPAPGTLRVYTF